MKICQETLYLFRIGQKFRAIYMTTKNFLVLPATLNSHKISAFGWNGIILLGYARRYKHYANAPQCYVMRTLPILFLSVYITPFQNCVVWHAAVFMFMFAEFAGPLNILHVSLYSAMCTMCLSVNMISWHCHLAAPSVAASVWRLVNSELVGMWEEAVVRDVVWCSVTPFACRNWGNTWKASGEISCYRGWRSGLGTFGSFGFGSPCICLTSYRKLKLPSPPDLKFNNSTSCPHSVFTCFVWIWEQTAIISLYSINWLVCITEI